MSRDRKSSVRSVMGGILCVIFIPVIFINLTLIISTYTKPGEMPGVFGIKPVIVLSGSMEPVIQTGDMIFLHSTDPARLQTGDVICYLDSGQAITHRIVAVREGEDGQVRYITQGDGNNTADRKAVRADQVQGIWRGGKITGLGNGIMFMQSTTGMILFMICPLCLFILWDIWRRRELDRKEAKHRADLEAELYSYRAREKMGQEEKEPGL